ncbi:MAG: FGGY-family carbohydrate kinase, partial [Bacteroidota bacterium]
MSAKFILSIDIGTQSTRAVLISETGEISDIEKIKIQAYYSENPGWAEQDPELFWDVAVKAMKAVIGRNGDKAGMIKAVTLTTQRGTVVNLDKDNNVLRPAIIWLDRRQAKAENWIGLVKKVGLWFINMLGAADYAYREAEVNWIKQNQPEIWAKTSKYLLLSGFINFRLTGKFRDSVANQVGYLPFNYKKHRWIKKYTNVRKVMFDVDEEKLPELVKPGEEIGRISKEVAQLTGLNEGIPVIAASADKSAEVLGSGVVDSSTVCLSYGTTATVQSVSEKYVELQPFFPPYPSAIPGKYNTEVMVYRGFWMIDWFKNEFGSKEVEKAKELGVEPEKLLDELICDIPPGAMGLTLQPYWSAGVKNPGLEAKGAIIGFGDVHTRKHIYRAIIEGLAYALRNGFEHTKRKTGINPGKIVVSGGGSQSDIIMQITADVFGIPAVRPHTYETSALGAAIDTAVALGWYNSFEEAAKKMTCADKIFHPNKENHDMYDRIYKEVYNKMYDRLKPLYTSIRNIF